MLQSLKLSKADYLLLIGAAVISILTAAYQSPVPLAFAAAPFCAAALFFPQYLFYYYAGSFFIGFYFFQNAQAGIVLNDLLFPVLVSAFYSGSARKNKVHVQIPNMTPYFLLTAVGLFSLLLNLPHVKQGNIFNGIVMLYRFLQIPIIFYITAKSDLIRIQLRPLLIFITILSALQYPAAYLQLAAYGQVDFVHGTFSPHHSMLGTAMLISMAVSLYLFLTASSLKSKAGHAVLFAVIFGTHLISSSRSATFGLLAAVGLFWLSLMKLNAKSILILAGGALFAFAVYQFTPLNAVIGRTFDSTTSTGIDISTASRLIIWDGAIKHFLSADIVSKLFGVGMGCYDTIKYDIVLWAGTTTATGAHNNILHVLSETGIIGLLCFTAVFVSTFLYLYRQFKTNIFAKILFYLTIAMLISGTTQETFWMQKSFANLWGFYIFVLALSMHTANTQTSGNGRENDQ